MTIERLIKHLLRYPMEMEIEIAVPKSDGDFEYHEILGVVDYENGTGSLLTVPKEEV